MNTAQDRANRISSWSARSRDLLWIMTTIIISHLVLITIIGFELTNAYIPASVYHVFMTATKTGLTTRKILPLVLRKIVTAMDYPTTVNPTVTTTESPTYVNLILTATFYLMTANTLRENQSHLYQMGPEDLLYRSRLLIIATSPAQISNSISRAMIFGHGPVIS